MRRSTAPRQNASSRSVYRPSAEIAVALREFCSRHGESVACQLFGINKATLARAAAGFPVLGSVLESVEAGLRTPPDEVALFVNAYGKRA